MSHPNVNHDLSNCYNQGNWRCHRFNPLKCNNAQLFQQAFLLDTTYIFSCFDQESPRKPTFTNFGTTRKVHTLHNKYVCMYLYVQGPRMMRIPINFLQSCQYYWLQIVIYLYTYISLSLERSSVIVVFLWFYKYP